MSRKFTIQGDLSSLGKAVGPAGKGGGRMPGSVAGTIVEVRGICFETVLPVHLCRQKAFDSRRWLAGVIVARKQGGRAFCTGQVHPRQEKGNG